ncbi:hypothetical protein HO173_007696 [Letharia columbiana]|uniref:IEC3 subunit of the Ino80 complex, chromatin re-modelling-domain-containing protein n=1 Tax=Letharia columbiana TaxID=112416 RepID=A0A8H6L3N3_9LECA|nr:uncharacterized protein HO173_007696 [Letharia columbiana]KAF6234274.1 hypothetical protein HO173_007696 [Letharia columbiana]
MSFATVNNQDAPPLPNEEPSRLSYKSYKKKFLKLRHNFKDKMRDSNRFFDEEQHSMRLARRLQEQNDQLLDLLLDVNESTKVLPHLRYDLRSPTPDASAVPALEPDLSPYGPSEIESTRAALEEAKQDLYTGQITPAAFKTMEAEFHAILNRTNSLSNLSRVQHTTLNIVSTEEMPKDLLQEAPIGYMTPSHEDEFLSALDTYLANLPPEAPLMLPRPFRPTDREREKDAQLRNPVSVYNWLREHRPKVFLQDPRPEEKESAPEKVSSVSESAGHKASPKPPSSGTAKRRSAAVPKQEVEPEPEVLDDEGNVIGGAGIDPPAPKTKRKRDDDAYRPKGGSSKPRKRGKGSSGAVVRKTEGEEEGP